MIEDKKIREVKEMKIICAWCGKTMSDPGNTTEISHGCCPDCAKTVRLEIEAFKAEQKRGGYLS